MQATYKDVLHLSESILALLRREAIDDNHALAAMETVLATFVCLIGSAAATASARRYADLLDAGLKQLHDMSEKVQA